MGTAERLVCGGVFSLSAACRGSVGGGNRDRTGDLLHAMQALSQLSYTPDRGAKLYSLLITRAEAAAADERARLEPQAAGFADEIDGAVDGGRRIAHGAGARHRHLRIAGDIEAVFAAGVLQVGDLAVVLAAHLGQHLLRIVRLLRRDAALPHFRGVVVLQRAFQAEFPVAGLDRGARSGGKKQECKKSKHQSSSRWAVSRCRTTSRPRSSSTASIEGVCVRPVTSRRNGMASCGILSAFTLPTSLIPSFNAARAQATVDSRALSIRSAFPTFSSQSGTPGLTSTV